MHKPKAQLIGDANMEEISYIVTKDDLIAWSTYYHMKTIKADKGKKWYAGWKWRVLGIILFLAGMFLIIKGESDLLSIPILFIGAFLFLSAEMHVQCHRILLHF